MRTMITGLLTAVVALGLVAGPADAAKKKRTPRAPRVVRHVAGYPGPDRTVITVNGVTRIVVNPRSYLDAGTEIGPNERSFKDYIFPTGGDPGRPNWFYGPDFRGAGHFPLPGPIHP